MKKCLKLFVLLILLTTFFVPGVLAKTGTSRRVRDSRAKVWIGANRDNSESTVLRFGEGVLGINNNMSYCVDWGKNLTYGLTYETVDIIDYFTNTTGYCPAKGCRNGNKSKAQAEELIKKLAMYDYFFKHFSTLGPKYGGSDSRFKGIFSSLTQDQIYFFNQVLVWETLDEYYGWGREHNSGNSYNPYWYWVEVNDPDYYYLFPASMQGDSDDDVLARARYENALHATAKNFYNKEKDKYTATGTIWYRNDSQVLLEFDANSLQEINYDLSLDSACVNCTTKAANGASYVIQDVDNWKLLDKVNKLPDKGNNAKIKKYFEKNVAGHLCREEYQIYFPTSSKVTVESGSYFTINEAAGFPNFEPFKIARIIQCVKKDGSKGDLNKLRNAYCKNGAGDSGEMKIWYQEKKGAGYDAYDLEWTNMRKVDSYCSSTQSGNISMVFISNNYKLPENTYKYIRNGTNKPLKKISSTANLDRDYTSTLVPNLPVALNHKASKKDEVAGYISLKFDFPSNSNMKVAFNETNNQYLRIEGQTKIDDANVYKLWRQNRSAVERDELNSTTIKNSACSKMYGYKTSGFEKCVSERVSVKNKTAICRNNNNASITYQTAAANKGYSCKVYMDPNDSCRIISVEKNEYINKNGNKISSKTDFINQCCDVDNHETLDRDWNPNLNDGKGGCCAAGTKYNEVTKTCDNKTQCTLANVGTSGPGYDFTKYTWTLIVDGSGQGEYGCCSPEQRSAGKCSSKVICKDGLNGTCGGDKKTCLCTSDGLCPEDHLNGQCPSPVTPSNGKTKCTKSGGKYYIDGKEISKKLYEIECCNESNHNELNRDWNPNDGGCCCGIDEEYDKTTKTCKPKGGCDECSDASLCCEAGHKYKCGVKDINGNLVCDDGKTESLIQNDDLVYRTIDLTSPFIGEMGNDRSTGMNWSYRSPDGKKSDNSANNSLVRAVINQSENVYSDDHALYKFTLNADNIDKIRSYNSSRRSSGGYSDFTLKCEKGNNCESSFIRNKTYVGDYSGICMSSQTNSNAYKKYCK